MTASTMSTDDGTPNRSRVAISARLIPAMSHVLAAIGGGLSASLIGRVMNGMRTAEGTGLSAVAAGMSESNLPVVVALYLAIICGGAGILLVVVRVIVPTKSVSPPTWFFLISGGLGLIPVALLWQVESLLIEAIAPGSGGIAGVASAVNLLSTLSWVAAALFLLLWLVGSLWPASSRSRPTWGPLVVLVAVEVALIVAAIDLYVRTSWLYHVAVAGRM